MKTLQEILESLGTKTKVFDKNGELTKKGSERFQKLIDLLDDIEILTDISTKEIKDELYNILNEN